MFGKDINVDLTKQGMFDWDFDVHNNDDSEDGKAKKGKFWMLVDCVGEQNAGNISYYIKYRHDSMAKSQILGSGNFEEKNLYMWNHVSGYGTYWRTRVHETWLEYCEWEVSDPQKPKAGKVKRYGWEKKSHTTDESGTDLINIVYKLHCYGQDYTIHYVKPKDTPWTKDNHLLFEASDGNGLPLFKITSDSKSKATVQTFSNADPVTALIAALGIAIKMTPHLFYTLCQKACDELFDLEAEPNTYGGSGRPDAEFEVHGRHDDFGEYSTLKPTVGFAYGVATQALPMGKPIEMPQHLFTAVAGVPTFDPRPRAFSPVTPEIGVVPALDPLPGVEAPEPTEPLLVTGSWLDSAAP